MTVRARSIPWGRNERLHPFSGTYVPGVCFASGHCVWLFDFDRTPTPHGGYSAVWTVSPDGERTLYTPADALETVERYHEFDRAMPASVHRSWDSPDDLSVRVAAGDGTDLTFSAHLDGTPATRLAGLVGRLTPRVLARHRAGLAAAEFALRRVLELGEFRMAGATGTGRRYRYEPDRIALVRRASATLDGADLGAVVPPSGPITFGDMRTPERPVCVSGTLYLDYPDG